MPEIPNILRKMLIPATYLQVGGVINYFCPVKYASELAFGFTIGFLAFFWG
jgi:hypothetical protein